MQKDILEENKAATAVIDCLSGKPIVGTSGDEDHRLNPVAVDFKVGISKAGEELAISITQTDRHHPHLVYDTVKQHFSRFKEFANYQPNELQPDKDYDAQSGKLTLRYNLPSGVADSIIHSLTERAEKKEPLEPINNSWVNRVIEYFTVKNSSFRG